MKHIYNNAVHLFSFKYGTNSAIHTHVIKWKRNIYIIMWKNLFSLSYGTNSAIFTLALCINGKLRVRKAVMGHFGAPREHGTSILPGVLQCVVVCCSALQCFQHCFVVCCNVLQCLCMGQFGAPREHRTPILPGVLQCVAVCYSVL